MSETLTGVTQLKIRDVCLFIYNVWTYIMSFCTLTLTFFSVTPESILLASLACQLQNGTHICPLVRPH